MFNNRRKEVEDAIEAVKYVYCGTLDASRLQ
jgi:hypothetical protein